MLLAVRGEDPSFLNTEMMFNGRRKRLVNFAAMCGHSVRRQLIAEVVELFRGYNRKLSTPVGHPPHRFYGSPLERYLRYRTVERVGDVRTAIRKNERTEELRLIG